MMVRRHKRRRFFFFGSCRTMQLGALQPCSGLAGHAMSNKKPLQNRKHLLIPCSKHPSKRFLPVQRFRLSISQSRFWLRWLSRRVVHALSTLGLYVEFGFLLHIRFSTSV
jgi:hypothetical protein